MKGVRLMTLNVVKSYKYPKRDELAPLLSKRIRLQGQIVKITQVKMKGKARLQFVLRHVKVDQVNTEIHHINITIHPSQLTELQYRELQKHLYVGISITGKVQKYYNKGSHGIYHDNYGICDIKGIQLLKDGEYAAK